MGMENLSRHPIFIRTDNSVRILYTDPTGYEHTIRTPEELFKLTGAWCDLHLSELLNKKEIEIEYDY